MIYFIIFCIILFFAILDYDKKLNIKSRNYAFYILFFVFWLTAGLRYETGVDWRGYTGFFNDLDFKKIIWNISHLRFYDQYEFGYILINVLVKAFSNNIQWLFLIIAFSTNLLLFSSIKEYSNHIFLSLLIYFGCIYFILDMSGIRQCISLNIFLYSLRFVDGNNFVKYLFAILAASLFHITSLLLIPVFFIIKIKFRSWILLLFVVLGVVISISEIRWIMPFIEKISKILGNEAISDKLYRYSIRGDTRIFGMGFILNLLIFIFCILERKKLSANKMYDIFLNLYLISIFFYYYTWELNEFSSRLRLYFFAGNIILFTFFFDVYKRSLNKFLVFLFIISFSIFYGRIYFFQLPEGLAYNPYQNYIVHKVFKLKSTGSERLDIFSSEWDK